MYSLQVFGGKEISIYNSIEDAKSAAEKEFGFIIWQPADKTHRTDEVVEFYGVAGNSDRLKIVALDEEELLARRRVDAYIKQRQISGNENRKNVNLWARIRILLGLTHRGKK